MNIEPENFKDHLINNAEYIYSKLGGVIADFRDIPEGEMSDEALIDFEKFYDELADLYNSL